jgi:hypothetical protein
MEFPGGEYKSSAREQNSRRCLLRLCLAISRITPTPADGSLKEKNKNLHLRKILGISYKKNNK